MKKTKTTKPAESTRPVGRPSKYKPEYCEEIIKVMGRGFSYEAFAGHIGVCDQTLYTWEKEHPEFLDAKRQAFAACRVFWENLGTQYAVGDANGPKLNTGVWIFNMKNRFRWTDRSEQSQTIDAKVKVDAGVTQELVDELKDLLNTGLSERIKP